MSKRISPRELEAIQERTIRNIAAMRAREERAYAQAQANKSKPPKLRSVKGGRS